VTVRTLRAAIVAVVLASVVVTGGMARAAASCAGEAAGGEWRSYGNDLHNTRSQPAEDLIDEFAAYDIETQWTFSVTGAGGTGGFQSTPTIADGCVFVATNTGTVFALNADTGELVWSSQTEAGGLIGGIFAVAVPGDGHVYATVGTANGPVAVALNETDGVEAWHTDVLDTVPGTITNSSAVVYNGMVFVAWSGPDADPDAHPGFAIIDGASGTILKKTLVIPDDDFAAGFAGGGIWATAVFDEDNGYAFAGTANPDSKEKEHRYANAILKIDVDPNRQTFGTIVDAYKGNFDNYNPGLYNQPACQAVGPQEPGYAVSCVQLDVDFGASPTLFRNSKGEKLVGELQKSGVFHAVYADTMQQAWTVQFSEPTALGNASTAAFDGTSIYVAANPGLLWALNPDNGAIRWVAPTAGGADYQPPSVANGVVYFPSTPGTLNTYDAATGQPLFVRPMQLDTQDVCANLGGGVAIARHKVYAVCDTGAAGGGWLIAYGWDGDAPLPPLPIPY
jgi:polyvinyl alcohol dehydrogenase (cytochrome)